MFSLNRRRQKRRSNPVTFAQGFLAGLLGVATCNIDVRMLPRHSFGPAVIAATLLVLLCTLPGSALGVGDAISFMCGALFSAHVNKGHAPRATYVYLWLVGGILAELWISLAVWAGPLQEAPKVGQVMLVVAMATAYWVIGSAKIRRVALAAAAADRRNERPS